MEDNNLIIVYLYEGEISGIEKHEGNITITSKVTLIYIDTKEELLKSLAHKNLPNFNLLEEYEY